MINSVTIVGNLTRQVDLRYSAQGTPIANFMVAVSRPFKNQNGERETDFISVVQFQKGAELTSQYTDKGSKVGVTGRIQTRNYENNEGKRVYVTEIVAEQVAFLDSKKDSEPKKTLESESEPQPNNSDDLPF